MYGSDMNLTKHIKCEILSFVSTASIGRRGNIPMPCFGVPQYILGCFPSRRTNNVSR